MTRLRDIDSQELESRMGFLRPIIWIRDMVEEQVGVKGRQLLSHMPLESYWAL
jgi:hypothetical protein